MKRTNSNQSYIRLLMGIAGWFLPGLLALLSLFLLGCQNKNYAKVPEEPAIVEVTPEQKIERGKYLVTTIGCADCHSPKQPGARGPEELKGLELSGFQQGQELPAVDMASLPPGFMVFNGDLTAGIGPWGTSFAANITSDETGIGNWTEEQFKTAMRKGKFKGLENGRDLLPPMPWFNFAHLTDEDLEAMFAYLKSTRPVENVVPAPIPPAPTVAMK
ncbi:c-type cytochrome [Salinimicrobium sp. TH3]|uniref:c-type cytochrome n=1 Tax=Salinimicrobium sp. TH3 TaxID=2997342 RepID=UPI002275E2A7|nr:c-type cytochrome [Salinimicrobium sp. TH3]MCY2688710.1 c-type cytochrome [Salinimicrobium sp. TH3]